MPVGAIIGIIIGCIIVVALIAGGLWLMARRRRLRQRFGPEYERTAEQRESQLHADQELAGREKRHAELDIRPLSPAARDRYARDWARLQERFVDAPQMSVNEVDSLVTSLMAERGYPTEGYEQQLADLSVEHSRTLSHYRAAHDVRLRAGRLEASTEDLRKAMVHYRALFEELLDNRSDGTRDESRPGRHSRA